MNPRRENAVRSLANLYTVVIGVALSLAVVQLVDPTTGLAGVHAHRVLLILALVFTLVPFYHGALRHLDDAYLENPNPQIRDGALVLDVLLLIVHGMVFVVLALLLDAPSQFAWVLLVLIGVDVLWAALAHFGFSSQTDSGAEGRWALINLIFVLVGIALMFSLDIGTTLATSAIKLATVILVMCILRTVLDYWWCWPFYFPKDEGPQQAPASRIET